MTNYKQKNANKQRYDDQPIKSALYRQSFGFQDILWVPIAPFPGRRLLFYYHLVSGTVPFKENAIYMSVRMKAA